MDDTQNAGELPKIPAPAARALASVGVTRLDDLTNHHAVDLAALHGMGPKAMRQLEAALAERGMSFRTDDS
jgi:hypothetical protein